MEANWDWIKLQELAMVLLARASIGMTRRSLPTGWSMVCDELGPLMFFTSFHFIEFNHMLFSDPDSPVSLLHIDNEVV